MARLVTVEQAARMAGVVPALLVGELNAALGIVPEPSVADGPPEPGPPAAQPSRIPPGAPVVEVDVREELRSGVEPFSRIMSAVTGLRDGEVLLLRNTFEPLPLYAVLGKRGLSHEASPAPDDWSVWFWRPSAPGASLEPPAATGGGPVPRPGEVRLDVRGLEPPGPMLRTLAALEALPPDHTLIQVNVRVPQFLLPMLAERGFTWEIEESSAVVLVRIRRAAYLSSPDSDQSRQSQERKAAMPSEPLELDVRPIPPREKHPAIFRTFDALASGQEMVIVNDHDPRPLRYQFQAERPDSFDWAYDQEGPEVWRVRISRR